VPMLRDKPEDAEVMAYCESLVASLALLSVFGQPLRAALDTKKIKSAEKRWNWVRRGAPVIVEIGPRDAASCAVTYMRRDSLRDGDKVRSQAMPLADFIAFVPTLLTDIQAALHAEARARLCGNIRTDVTDWAGVESYFAGSDEEFKGWLRIAWSKPSGEALEAVNAKLKVLKLTIRNAPLDQPSQFGPCMFGGGPGREEILIGRSY
jgi:prolyl-tRNA synthetase